MKVTYTEHLLCKTEVDEYILYFLFLLFPLSLEAILKNKIIFIVTKTILLYIHKMFLKCLNNSLLLATGHMLWCKLSLKFHLKYSCLQKPTSGLLLEGFLIY